MISTTENLASNRNPASIAAGFTTIEKGALKVRKDNDELAALVNELNERIMAAKRELLPKIRKSVDRLKTSSAELLAEVKASPRLFESPKTQMFHGIKVGWPKSRGGLEIVNEARTIERAEKELTAEQFDMVVKVTRELRKKALGTLPNDTLKKLGVNTLAAGERPIVSITEGDVMEIVNALLNETTEREA